MYSIIERREITSLHKAVSHPLSLTGRTCNYCWYSATASSGNLAITEKSVAQLSAYSALIFHYFILMYMGSMSPMRHSFCHNSLFSSYKAGLARRRTRRRRWFPSASVFGGTVPSPSSSARSSQTIQCKPLILQVIALDPLWTKALVLVRAS